MPEGEYYWSQLIGMQVIDQEHGVLGQVVEVMVTGANDILIVKEEKEYLIPYIPRMVIVDVDLGSEQVIVSWGLN